MSSQNSPLTVPLFSKSYIQLALANFFMIAGMGCSLVFPLFILHFGGSKSDIGILMGAMSLAAVASRPWVSELIDRIGRRRSYITGCLLMGTVSLLYISLQQSIDTVFTILFGLRLIYGIGFALAMVAALTWASDLIPSVRFNEGIGIFGATGLLGMAVGPLVAEGIIYRWGFPAMFICAGLISLTALLIGSGIKEQYQTAALPSQKSFFQILQNPQLGRITLIALCFGIGYAAHISFVAPYARSQNMLAAPYYLAYSAAAITARLALGRIADRVGEIRIIPPAILLTGIGFTSLIWADTGAGLSISGIITGLGHGVLFPCLLALAIRPVATQNRGKANGIFTGGVDGGIFIGALLLGHIGEQFGFPALFATSGTSLIVGLTIFWLTRKTIFSRSGRK